MGLGNGNPNEGNKGSNFNFELKMLQGLEAIANALDGGGGSGDPALNPGPALSSGVFDCYNAITFSDTNIDFNQAWGSYTKVGNIITTSIFISGITGITTSSASLTVVLPVTVVGDLTENARYLSGTMETTGPKAMDLIESYTLSATDVSTVQYDYNFNSVTSNGRFVLQMSYVYNTNIVTIEAAPIAL
jgi:hypothetical protein